MDHRISFVGGRGDFTKERTASVDTLQVGHNCIEAFLSVRCGSSCSPRSVGHDKSPLFSRLQKRYFQVMIVQEMAIEQTDGFVPFTLGAHRYVCISLGSTRLTIFDDIDCDHISSLREEIV